MTSRAYYLEDFEPGETAANLERVMPDELSATIDRSTWTPQPIFDLVRRVGSVEQADLEKTLNCGVGMVALVAPEDVDRAIAILDGYGVAAWAAGEVAAASGASTASSAGSVTLTGQYDGW